MNQGYVNPHKVADSRIARQALTSPACSLEGLGVTVPDMISSVEGER